MSRRRIEVEIGSLSLDGDPRALGGAEIAKAIQQRLAQDGAGRDDRAGVPDRALAKAVDGAVARALGRGER